MPDTNSTEAAESSDVSSAPQRDDAAPGSSPSPASAWPSLSGGGGSSDKPKHSHQRSRSVNLSPVMAHSGFPQGLGAGWEGPRAGAGTFPSMGGAMAPSAAASERAGPSAPNAAHRLSTPLFPPQARSALARKSPDVLPVPDEGAGAEMRRSRSSSSNGSDSGAYASDEQRAAGRQSERGLRLSGAAGSASIRAASPARAFGVPVSPRLQAFGTSSPVAAARRRSIDPGTRSPIIRPASPRAIPVNPDPNHPFDSVWPAESSPSSSSSASPSTSPHNLDGISIPSPHRFGAGVDPLQNGSSSMTRQLSHSPREVRHSFSSPVLRTRTPPPPVVNGGGTHARQRSGSSRGLSSSPVQGRRMSRGAEDPLLGLATPPSPPQAMSFARTGHKNVMEALAMHSRSSSSSSSSSGGSVEESPTAKALSPPSGPQTQVDAQNVIAGISIGEPLRAADLASNLERRNSGGETLSSTLEAARSALNASPAPLAATMPADFLSSSGMGTYAPFRSRSPVAVPSPSRTPPPHLDPGMGESPPKVRSFIGMPPRSGYELSDDPDDVGSEDGSNGSRSGSINEDDDRDTEERDRDVDSDDDARDDEMGGEPHAESSESAADESSASPAAGSAARPHMPKRPSLTRSPVVPPLLLLENSLPPGAGPGQTSERGWPLTSQRDSMLGFYGGGDGNEPTDWRSMGSEQMDWLSPDRDNAPPGGRAGGEIPGGVDSVDPALLDGQQAQSDVPMEEEAADEGLSTLERMFLFAKSEMTFHRVLVARSLADWIYEIDLSDAVEYVIPLLNGLGTDELDVCAAFTPELHRLMWYFFRNCPLDLPPASDAPAPPEEDDAQEHATRPVLSVEVFTPLLCALLLNSNNSIASAAQMALVQFFARIRGATLSDAAGDPIEDERQAAEWQFDTSLVRDASGREGQRVELRPYDFGKRERDAVEAELLENVAFAIGKLHTDTARQAAAQAEDASSAPATEQPEQDSLAEDAPERDADVDMSEREDSDMEIADPSSSTFHPSSPVTSAYDKADVDEEAAVGRMASVSLLAALAAEALVSVELLEQRVVPEIVQLQTDAAFFVRKEVAIAIGALAKHVPAGVVMSSLMPAFHAFVGDDIWHVRQAICLSIPALFAQVERDVKRQYLIDALRTFSADVSRNVRSAALEIIGEAIYLFHEDPAGVPDELVRHFLGEPFDGTGDGGESAGARASDPFSGFDSENWLDEMTSRPSLGFDAERPLVMAYNFPAVVLTLGADNWPRLREAHRGLVLSSQSPKVRRSLAASLHEVAKIIGPQRAHEDLVELFEHSMWSADTDAEVKGAAIEHLDVFLGCLPAADAEGQLQKLHSFWSAHFEREWRLRERLAQHIPALAERYLLEDESGNLVTLMQLALADPISAVRDAGVASVPALYRIFSAHDQEVADGFLGMLADMGAAEGYRSRVACVLAMQALFEAHVERSSVELSLMERLVELAQDRVIDVRIYLARAVALMCRLDVLYASPHSRSTALLGILARLHRDTCPEVRDPILAVLAPEDVEALPAADPAPTLDERRELVLGPAGGGPHKPARSEGEPMFDMDEAAAARAIPDVNMQDAARDPSHVDPDASMFEEEDDDEEREEQPHHLLNVGGPDSPEQARRPLPPSDEGWLTSPERAADAPASSTPGAADPFLSYVAGRRSDGTPTKQPREEGREGGLDADASPSRSESAEPRERSAEPADGPRGMLFGGEADA